MINKARRAVSIHAPAWGATACPFVFTFVKNVSIHAPAWGATAPTHTVGTLEGVSIHAPAWGATLLQAQRWQKGRFQFTLPRGERRVMAVLVCAVVVSIHAPAWGATRVGGVAGDP